MATTIRQFTQARRFSLSYSHPSMIGQTGAKIIWSCILLAETESKEKLQGENSIECFRSRCFMGVFFHSASVCGQCLAAVLLLLTQWRPCFAMGTMLHGSLLFFFFCICQALLMLLYVSLTCLLHEHIWSVASCC